MLKDKKIIALAALCLLLLSGPTFAEGEKPEAYYFGPSRDGGIVSESPKGTFVSFSKIGAFGFYDVDEIEGNFDLRCGIKPGEGPCGIMLFKVNDGKPDPSNFVGIERKTDADGNKVVRVFAIKEGRDFILPNSKFRPSFEFTLDSEELGRDAPSLRIARDDKAGCLHFYYGYERTVDGEKRQGWMEFSTLPDWDKRPFYFYRYIKSNGDFTAKALFADPVITQVPSDDEGSKGQSFKAEERDYSFSGFFGRAVVVTFDKEFPFNEKSKFVFWSEAEYIPWWHVDDKCAVSYGFVSARGEETEGTCGPAGDRLLRWSKAEIVASNKARVVVHWRYMLANNGYNYWSMDPAGKPYADEWFYFYPDGTGTRKVVYSPVMAAEYAVSRHFISNLSVVKRGGEKPSKLIDRKAISILDLDVKKVDYLWDLSGKKSPAERDDSTKDWAGAVCRVNLFKRPAVFEAFAACPGNYGENEAFEARGEGEFDGDFSVLSNWPINNMPYEDLDKTTGRFIREPGYVSLLPVEWNLDKKGPATWAMLVGMTKPSDDKDARDRALSWMRPGEVKIIGDGAKFIENDLSQRALIFEAGPNRICNFTVDPKAASSAIINPVFIIKNWGDNPVSVKMNKKILKESTEYRYAIEGNDAVIWVKARFSNLTSFLIN